ncbi:hypothetical protein F5Y11DRAFT_195548 [Daldinia sp. FL1419]|nr:hypothetical protein F5Y11DRAFT_195548 [Daldinia sp. FL1419]
MCTGTCWVYRCRQCTGILYKDTGVSGHTCNAARGNRIRGCCRTGVEYTFFSKLSDELCVLCGLGVELEAVDADVCDVAEAEHASYGENDPEENGQEGGARLFAVIGGVKMDWRGRAIKDGNGDDDDDDDDDGGASLKDGDGRDVDAIRGV